MKKTMRYLFELVATNRQLREKLARLQKAYNALNEYCTHLIARLEKLEARNAELEQQEGAECRKPTNKN